MDKPQKVRKARKWLGQMQKVLPTAVPVYVSARPCGSYWGEVKKRRKGFEIRANWDWPWDVLQTWVLPHEYAHARVWGRVQAGNEDHDGHFYLEIGVVDEAADLLGPHEID